MLTTFLSVLSQIPLIMVVAVRHLLGWTAQSKYLDQRTEVSVAVLRSLMSPYQSQTVTSSQLSSLRDPGIQGKIWVSKYAPPLPTDTGVRDALVKAIDGLRHPLVPKTELRLPEIATVEAEWTGYRSGATAHSQLPNIPERDKYAEMIKECQTPTTILYFHGGAYWLLDPASHRVTTKKLAKLTGGRCYSVRYRLAPQHAFPAALLDALVSFLALLYPPPGAYHEPVRPEHIVFAGDR